VDLDSLSLNRTGLKVPILLVKSTAILGSSPDTCIFKTCEKSHAIYLLTGLFGVLYLTVVWSVSRSLLSVFDTCAETMSDRR
jgi:hypothetical protein